jgi:hypothetical protein
LFDAAFLMMRYRSEYAMLELPSFVRRVVIPMLFVVGRVLGKHEKYRDAPEPMKKRPVPTLPLWPMPPSPIWAVTSYGPSRVPAVSMRSSLNAQITGRPDDHIHRRGRRCG